MKIKLFLTSVSLILFFGCSTSNDSNGSTNTTVVPMTPSNLTGTVASTTQINLSWTDVSTNETGFKIERKTLTGTFAVVGTTTKDITTFSDTALTSNTTYVYRVYSYNATGNSPTYSNELTLTSSSSTVTDIDGNSYALVTICSQVWTQTDLKVSKYRNGDIIPQVSNTTAWTGLTTGAWCYNSTYGSGYGKLYNWYAVIDPRGLAPTGYHIPTDAEWTTLTTCLGGAIIAGGKMKETGTNHWSTPNTAATNSSLFTGLPQGCRTNNGAFANIGGIGYWWSSTEATTTSAWTRYLSYDNGVAGSYGFDKKSGFTVRCLRD